MFTNPKWLDALKLPLRVTIAVALASSALLVLEWSELLDLSPLGAIASPTLVILSVVSSILALVGVIDNLMAPVREKRRQSMLTTRRAVRRKEEEEQHGALQAQIIACLDHLSKEEIRYVADSLREGSPTFYAYVHSPAVSMLGGKGLVWTPGGLHNQDHCPFSFCDFVWEVLVERKDEFLAEDDEHKRAAKAKKGAEIKALRRRRDY